MLSTRPTPETFNLSERERSCMQHLIDYSSVQSLPEIWPIAQEKFGDTIALCDPHTKPEIKITYRLLYQQIQQFAVALQILGVQAAERIALFADNSPRWLIADQGIMTAGAVDAVRGGQADKQELLYILQSSGSTALVIEDLKILKKLRPELDSLPIKFVILLSDEQPAASETLKVLNFPQLMAMAINQSLKPVKQDRQTLATLLYTSGTGGQPKSVMLSHGNLMHQVTVLGAVVQPEVGDVVLSILPIWHAFERSGEYFLLSQGCTQIYTNLRMVKRDLKEFKPHYMIAVPRLWESIYEGVQKQFREQPASKQRLVNSLLGVSERFITAQRIFRGLSLKNLHPSIIERLISGIMTFALFPIHALGEKLVYRQVRLATGGRIKQVITGGGALPTHIDDFFELMGIEILQGCGLTETSPVTHARRPWRNLRGSCGQPIPGVETKIVSQETRQPLLAEAKGLVLLRGPQIMQGYYQNPEATAKVIDAEGWFDSGDLGWVTEQNDLVLTGRAKDTIVLTNGENIEPTPIEDACLRSPYIDQIMLVGQDQRSLGALIVPNIEALQKWAEGQNLHLDLSEKTASDAINLESPSVQNLFRQELNREVQNRPGYRADDRIGGFKLILEPFALENGMMTQTLKIRRHIVMDRYRDTIDGMFS